MASVSNLDRPATAFVARPRVPPPLDGGLPEVAAAAGGLLDGESSGGGWVDAVATALAPLGGRVRDLLGDPAATDLFVNGEAGVWVDRGAGPTPVRLPTVAEAARRAMAVRLLALGGRHIDEATPCADARLPGGLRVHAVLPPIAVSGTHISIRLPARTWPTLDDLDAGDYFSGMVRTTVEELVASRASILVTGAAGSGKTTLLSAILAAVDVRERIVAIEDVAELRVRHPQFIALEARQANIEGAGEIGLARLVRESLRMRPDRLVVGECRGAEVGELLSALNTGHDGGGGTLHASSIADVPARLEAVGALAGLSPTSLGRQAVSGIDAIIHLERVDGRRRIAGAAALVLDRRGRLGVRESHT